MMSRTLNGKVALVAGATRGAGRGIAVEPRYTGRAVAHLAGDPDVARWSGRSLSNGQLAKVYGFTDLDGSQPDCWRYLHEVMDAGKPADVTGYR
jgi:NAD(P)-dependent dehydrogenase (short-subunit alcohol dehydrogenase family)